MTGIVKLESIFWWVHVVSILVSPALEKASWSLTAEAVVVGYKTKKGKRLWKPCRTETRIVTDVRDSRIPSVIGAGAITSVESIQERRLDRGKLVSENKISLTQRALPAAS